MYEIHLVDLLQASRVIFGVLDDTALEKDVRLILKTNEDRLKLFDEIHKLLLTNPRVAYYDIFNSDIHYYTKIKNKKEKDFFKSRYINTENIFSKTKDSGSNYVTLEDTDVYFKILELSKLYDLNKSSNLQALLRE